MTQSRHSNSAGLIYLGDDAWWAAVNIGVTIRVTSFWVSQTLPNLETKENDAHLEIYDRSNAWRRSCFANF
jgi:hypothetical protein